MGRIKPKMVKNTAKSLLAEEHSFTPDFDHNKKLLGNHMPSKKIRNKIAGYLARLVRAQKTPRVIKEKEEEPEFNKSDW